MSPTPPALQMDFLPQSQQGKPINQCTLLIFLYVLANALSC